MPVMHVRVLKSFVGMVNGRPVLFEAGTEANISEIGWIRCGFVEPVDMPFLPTVEWKTLEPPHRATNPRARAKRKG